jgi:flagellar assembly protein FliH
MSAPAKFLFDVDFSAREKPAETETTFSQAALEIAQAEAEARGYRNGFAAAQAEVTAEAQRRLTAAMDRIASALGALGGGLQRIENRLEAEAVDVAVAVASKLAPELIAREPFGEIAALAAECFNHLIAAPHVVVRVNDQLYADARERLEEIARVRGFEGRLVVLAEPHIAVGDCRIEWADGGVVRDRAAVEAGIDEAVTRYVAVRRDSET